MNSINVPNTKKSGTFWGLFCNNRSKEVNTLQKRHQEKLSRKAKSEKQSIISDNSRNSESNMSDYVLNKKLEIEKEQQEQQKNFEKKMAGSQVKFSQDQELSRNEPKMSSTGGTRQPISQADGEPQKNNQLDEIKPSEQEFGTQVRQIEEIHDYENLKKQL